MLECEEERDGEPGLSTGDVPGSYSTRKEKEACQPPRKNLGSTWWWHRAPWQKSFSVRVGLYPFPIGEVVHTINCFKRSRASAVGVLHTTAGLRRAGVWCRGSLASRVCSDDFGRTGNMFPSDRFTFAKLTKRHPNHHSTTQPLTTHHAPSGHRQAPRVI